MIVSTGVKLCLICRETSTTGMSPSSVMAFEGDSVSKVCGNSGFRDWDQKNCLSGLSGHPVRERGLFPPQRFSMEQEFDKLLFRQLSIPAPFLLVLDLHSL